MAKLRIPDDVMEYFRKAGSMGGKARAKKYMKRAVERDGQNELDCGAGGGA
jgi:hypothetical protein